ncbi:MAG TPA: copper resistance protein NlpE N-terminal domain-containing protein [Aquaticitalea sp.]|nr:copper resistance protein NlpE N-terminal domain-containing protein [Aquaticitalea sp.]
MLTSKLSYSVFLLLAILFSCNNSKKNDPILSTPESGLMGHNSMNSLDWAGTYEGTLPCADCKGIKTVISINQDNTYVAKDIYQGKNDSLFETKGTFKWDETGQKINFSDASRHSYFVGENTLTHLDKDGNKITGDLAQRYILTKVNDELVGKKWHLVSFKGEEIQLEEAKAERPYLEFADDFTVTGYTGCNNLRGGYSLDDAQKIRFTQLISTKKFCPEMETENEFLVTLNNAAYYSFKEHALLMFDDEHTKMAEFKVANGSD